MTTFIKITFTIFYLQGVMEENESKESYAKKKWKRIKMTDEKEEEEEGCTLILIHPWMLVKTKHK